MTEELHDNNQSQGKRELPPVPHQNTSKRRYMAVHRHAVTVGRQSARVVKKTLQPFVRIHFILSFLLTVIVLGAIFVAFTYITYANDITTKEKIMNRNNLGIIVYDKNKKTIFREGQAHDFKITPLDQVSKYMIDATLAAEDANFYHHRGISITALMASFLADFKHLDPFKYGGSTITQQVVKNALVGREKSYARKLREVVLAVEIERRYSKDEILEIYMNSIYYGAGAYGVDEAAKVFFNKNAKDLSLGEAAYLAGLPNAPSYLSPYGDHKQAGIDRQAYVLSQMQGSNFISPKEAQAAHVETLSFKPYQPIHNIQAPHFSLYVRNLVFNQYTEEQAERYGYRVYTTLDGSLQEIGEEAVKKRVGELAKNKVTNGALVALDPKSGAILTMVGSVDYNNDEIGGKFNIAVDGIGRQPGSSFKPFVYAAAFDRQLLTPASILQDQPKDFGDFGGEHFKPKNYDGKFRGPVTVRRALANSLNIPAVEALQLVGVSNAIDTAENLGISTLKDRSRYGLSLVLGGGEVHLLDMVEAYSVFANNGKKYQPYAIEKIVDKFGNTVYDRNVDSQTDPIDAMDARVAYLITSILSDNNARSEVFGVSSPLRLARPVAAKTGTTDNYKDSWTLGYTPNLVAGAWIGNNDGTPMTGVAGSIGAAYVWNNFMEKALVNFPKQEFTEPAGIVHVKTCRRLQTKEVRYLDNGQPYDHFEDKILTTDEVFIQGTEGKESCQDVQTPGPGVAPSPIESIQDQQTRRLEPATPTTPKAAPTIPAGYVVNDRDRYDIVFRDNRLVFTEKPKQGRWRGRD